MSEFWSLDDLADAHDTLDGLEEAEELARREDRERK